MNGDRVYGNYLFCFLIFLLPQNSVKKSSFKSVCRANEMAQRFKELAAKPDNPQNPHNGKRKLTPTNHPLTSMYANTQ